MAARTDLEMGTALAIAARMIHVATQTDKFRHHCRHKNHCALFVDLGRHTVRSELVLDRRGGLAVQIASALSFWFLRWSELEHVVGKIWRLPINRVNTDARLTLARTGVFVFLEAVVVLPCFDDLADLLAFNF